MAIVIGGTAVSDIKNAAFDAQTEHRINLEARLNLADTAIQNIPAGVVTGNVLACSYPDMRQLENDICSWF